MAQWTSDEIKRIGGATELQVASRRKDGTLRPWVTIWVAVVGDSVFLRSAHGPANGWFARAKRSGAGKVRAGGVEREVTFVPADPATAAEVTSALHKKYDRYGPGPVAAITGPQAGETTLLAIPADA